MIITSNMGMRLNKIYIPNNPSSADDPVMRTTEAINPAMMAMIPTRKKRVQF